MFVNITSFSAHLTSSNGLSMQQKNTFIIGNDCIMIYRTSKRDLFPQTEK